METTRVAALLLAAALLAGCANQNVHTDTFASFAEARERGAVGRGWVPSELPPEAYELRAAYEPDGERRWGILNFKPESADALRGILSPEEVSVAGTGVDIPPRVEWWPIALRNQLDAPTLATTGLKTYRSRSGTLLFAVNWKQGRAYYWTPAR